MAARALPLSSSWNGRPYGGTPASDAPSPKRPGRIPAAGFHGVRAEAGGGAKEEEEEKKGGGGGEQSLFGRVAEALDFSQVRSSEDALLLDEARRATRSGGRMTREQYGALRRKIGGTYKDFFKSYVDDEFSR